MKSSEVRNFFLEFFKAKEHKILPSDALIPSSDPTLLFTSAGMVQFKNYFMGTQKGLSRVVTSQKCFRTTDIEKIGHTPRHLSFFEMLGNFSFGDYFKEEAINWAWEFLTEQMKLDKNNLYITVYKDDEEALNIWKRIVAKDRIYKLGEETNFWNMGPTGPCGPCSEIIYDLGQEIGCRKKDCNPGCDCDRWLEVWNLVFTQYNRNEDGSLSNLPQKNIDTGMGLERLCMLVNSKRDVFETDLFQPIILYTADIMNVPADRNISLFKLIADHTRAILFLMSDGVIASNEGRGYVLRRIIRRAQRSAKLLGYEKPFLYKTISKAADIMSPAYPDILTQLDNIAILLKSEEEKFLETLDSGLKILDSLLEKNSRSKTLSGKDAFYLYETYGFPFDLTKEICAEKGFLVDEESFISAQNKAKTISRASWKGVESKETAVYEELKKRFGPTDFAGYENVSVETEIISIIKDKKISHNIIENETGEIVLKRTPFYAESGGQVGDTGEIEIRTGSTDPVAKAEVLDTQKPAKDLIIHKVRIKKGEFKTGDKVIAKIDENRRKDIARHHTATHLLHKALREILGKSVVQAGSLVAPDYLRFDFLYPAALKSDEIVATEKLVNDAIMSNMKVCINQENIEMAKKRGAMALFGEKYSDIVRTVAVESQQTSSTFSLELCGGTHVQNTGEIGMFKIISESSIGSGIRRIVAVGGRYCQEYLYGLQSICNEASEELGVSVKDIPTAIRKIMTHQKNLEKEIEKLKMKMISNELTEIAKTHKILGGIKFISTVLNNYEEKFLMAFAEGLLAKINSGIVFIVNKKEDLFSYLVLISEDVAAKSISANNIAKVFAGATSSSGGGKETLARGGGKELAKIPEGIKAIEKYIESNTQK